MCRIFANQSPARYQPTTRRLRLNGQSTSVRLEAAFWEILDGIAADDEADPEVRKTAKSVSLLLVKKSNRK